VTSCQQFLPSSLQLVHGFPHASLRDGGCASLRDGGCALLHDGGYASFLWIDGDGQNKT